MIRRLCAALARQPWLRKLAMSTPVLRRLAWGFVAGESLAEGLQVVQDLNAKGIKGTLNCIGTHVRSRGEAVRAADTAIQCLRRIREAGLESHLSLKLTQIGLDLDPEACRQALARVLEAARATGNFVRIDMEESAYTEVTLRIFEEARAWYPDSVGIVLQSYLRRTRADLERMVTLGAAVRLVKGGYWESSAAAFGHPGEIDAAFLGDLEYLVRHGKGPALATHDPRAIERAIAVAEAAGLGRSAMEFQLLYGVRQDLAEGLAARGFRVRCYVPFGDHWYEYVLGCLRRDPGRILRALWPWAGARTTLPGTGHGPGGAGTSS